MSRVVIHQPDPKPSDSQSRPAASRTFAGSAEPATQASDSIQDSCRLA